MKIILSNIELSESARKRLETAIRNRGYELRSGQGINSSEKNHVEVLLPQHGDAWLTKEKIGELPSLRFVQSYSAGVEHIEFEVIPQSVIVCGNVGAFSEPIAEHVFGMIIVLGRRLFLHNASLKKGYYDHRTDAMFLKGKKVGIIGAGGIGQAVARLAKGFGMKTSGVNRSGKRVEYFDEITTMENIGEVLSQADVVVLSLPLSLKTKGLIDRSKLEQMKENCILVNVARAGIVVEEDLYNHLKNHPTFRAGFDVWWSRPKQGHEFAQRFPFFELENFIGTPHVSGDVWESHDLASNSLVDNVIRYLDDQPLRGVANRDDYIGLLS